MNTEIISVHNPRVKQWSQLLERNGRDKYQKYVIEGMHLIEEAIHAHVPIETIVYLIDKEVPSDLVESTKNTQIEWIAASEQVISKCTDSKTPQSIFAILPKPQFKQMDLWADDYDLVIAVDGVQDPGNLGTMIRSSDAVGANLMILGHGTVDMYNPKTIRSSMGSIFHLPIVEADLHVVLNDARYRSKIQLVTTSPYSSKSCYVLNYRQPTCFIVGNEARGVSSSLANLAHHDVMIPMVGRAESLNVAMATTVLLFEARRQRY